jgi:S1-C subfamily serine protease
MALGDVGSLKQVMALSIHPGRFRCMLEPLIAGGSSMFGILNRLRQPLLRIAAGGALAIAVAAWAQAPVVQAGPTTGREEARSQALRQASDAVVGLQARAIEDARSITSLGAERMGSGVVISADGLVLTVGYLILEAEQVTLTTDDGGQWPARVVAYDLATGFGLVQSLVPLKLAPVPLGRSADVSPQEVLMIVSGGEQGVVSPAQLQSRRGFAGNWEYHIDDALFTAPARRDHSGAGLFNGRGELLGIGSLWVADALGAGVAGRSGNMFVPVDLLKPVLQEMRERGASHASQRAWLGLQAAETASGLRVMRVSEDSPADVAGVQAGDSIDRIDGQRVTALDALWKTLWAGGPPEREIKLDLRRDGQPLSLTLQSVDRMKTLRRPKGV